MKTSILSRSLVVVALAFGIAACDSSGNGPLEQKKVYAGKDSHFTYKKTRKSPDGTLIPGSDTVIEAVVVEGPHAFKGKDSVITVVENGRDTIRMAYEVNGDVSVYSGAGFSDSPIPLPFTIPDWGTLPVKSRGQLPILSQDINMTIDLGGFSLKIVKIVGTAAFFAEEDVAVSSSEALKSGKVKVDFAISYQLGLPITSTYTTSTTYWYSEKLGYFSKFDVQNDQIPIGSVDPGNYVQVLTSYSLK